VNNQSFLLSDEEKARFCWWLEAQIASAKGVIEQFKKLPPPLSETLIKKESMKLAGYSIVLADIRSGESMTVEHEQ